MRYRLTALAVSLVLIFVKVSKAAVAAVPMVMLATVSVQMVARALVELGRAPRTHAVPTGNARLATDKQAK